MDQSTRAVFIGAIVSMLLSTLALRNHPSECYIKTHTLGTNVTHVTIGTTDE